MSQTNSGSKNWLQSTATTVWALVCVATSVITSSPVQARVSKETATSKSVSRLATEPAERAPVYRPDRRPASRQLTKPDLLKRLQSLQNRQVLEITALEDAAKKRLRDASTTDYKAESAKYADHQLTKLTEQISSIDARRNELLARRQLIDQTILVVDSKWNGVQPIQEFLERQFLDMAANDLTNPQGSSDLWKFTTYLSVTVREAPERDEDIMNLVESYMNFATVLNPKTPAEFMESRDYTNGTVSATAQSVENEDLGAYAEAKLKETSRPKSKSTRSSDIELRMKIPPPQPEPSVKASEKVPEKTSEKTPQAAQPPTPAAASPTSKN